MIRLISRSTPTRTMIWCIVMLGIVTLCGFRTTIATVNIDIRVKTAWKQRSGDSLITVRGNSAGDYGEVWWEDSEIEPPPPPKFNYSFSTNDTGYHNYTGAVGCDGYRITFYLSNDVSRIWTMVDGNEVEINESTALLVPDQSCNEDRDVTLDWYSSDLLAAHPEFVGELSVAHYVRAMHDWYATWLGELFVFQRIETHCRITELSHGGTIIYLDAINMADPFTTCHEFAHVVMIQNQGMAVEAFMQEGQAQYFAGRMLGGPEFLSFGSAALYQDNYGSGTHYNLPTLSDAHEYGDILNHVAWNLIDSVGGPLVDSLVFLSIVNGNALSMSESMRDMLIYDDDNENLADGTPHSTDIFAAYAQAWIGPDLPTVFVVNAWSNYLNGDQMWGPIRRSTEVRNLQGDHVDSFATLDTYPMDSLVWDFGDGTPNVVQTERSTVSETPAHNGFSWVKHSYENCGAFEIICSSHHPWGSRIDTLRVNVTSPDSCGNYICGDVDYSGFVSVSDVVYLYTYMWSGGPAPIPFASGDLNCTDMVNISDYLVLCSYIFSGGTLNCCGGTLAKTATMSAVNNEPIEKLNSTQPRR